MPFEEREEQVRPKATQLSMTKGPESMKMKQISRTDSVVAPCTDACPAGVDVPRYIRAVRDGRYDEALAVLREKLPLPTVCADACFAPCEDACAYRQFGDPIAIRALKRTAVDCGGTGWKNKRAMTQKSGRKVAVVGAGPAGLTAAYYLANVGHTVTLYDAFPKPGGMLRYGIPKYRLPEDRLDRDIAEILELGVVFQAETVVGRDLSLKDLRETHDAVFLASGANGSARIPLQGADKQGVYWGWDFLRDVALGRVFDLGRRVAVVGGGNVAVDVALSARRLGAGQVELFCLETREEMPAHPWEIALAEEEGVVIHNAWAPKKVLGQERATGLGLIRCTAVFDDACNFDPVYDDEITHKVLADSVILAIGQTPQLGFAQDDGAVRVTDSRIEVTDDDLGTGTPGLVAGGDVVSGPASIIQAIAHGRRAAAAIDRYLGGTGDISEQLAAPEETVGVPETVRAFQPRCTLPLIEAWRREGNFDQVEGPLSEAAARAEAARCLNCDVRRFAVVVNAESCKECGYCAAVCTVGTFEPAPTFNAKGYRPMQVKSCDWCVGCLKCFFACPDFAIDVREMTA